MPTMTLALIESLGQNPLYFFSVVFTVVLSICIHELAHGYAAIRCGDRTPLYSGHMTLNPVIHMGPWSLVMLMLAGIAWGQMPIDPSRLRGRYAEAKVAFAGPLSNLLLALAALGALGLWIRFAPELSANLVLGNLFTTVNEQDVFGENLRSFLFVFGFTNGALFCFNLLPVPPLDGSHILANFSRGYARFIFDPANQSVVFILFIFAAGAAIRLFSFVKEASENFVTLLAG